VGPTDGNRFRDVLRGLCKVYGTEPDAVMLDVYWMTLNDWPLTDFEAAAAHLLRTSRFMPRPADFHALRQATELCAPEAWAEAMARCGGWRDGSAGRDGDRIDRTVHCVGGYRTLAMADVEHDLPHIQRRFLEAFDVIADSERVREALPQLAGEDTRRRLRSTNGFQQIGQVAESAEDG